MCAPQTHTPQMRTHNDANLNTHLKWGPKIQTHQMGTYTHTSNGDLKYTHIKWGPKHTSNGDLKYTHLKWGPKHTPQMGTSKTQT